MAEYDKFKEDKVILNIDAKDIVEIEVREQEFPSKVNIPLYVKESCH